MEEHENSARTVHFLRRGDSFGVRNVCLKLLVELAKALVAYQ